LQKKALKLNLSSWGILKGLGVFRKLASPRAIIFTNIRIYK